MCGAADLDGAMLATLLTIAVLHWVVLITPGVNMLVISQLAASGQRKAACFCALGVASVALTWAILAIMRVNAIFAAHAYLRQALQGAGGAYLVYVALRLWQAGGSSDHSAPGYVAPAAAFRLGFLTNIMNPKSALFFGSVFATALPPQPAPELLAAAVGLALANTLSWHIFLALAFSDRRVQAAYARWCNMLNRIAGALVGAFGLRLLATTVEEVRAR